MGKINSRSKGARGEREWAKFLTDHGYEAKRGQQHSGSPDSPDVICKPLDWAHWEVKRVECFNAYKAMEQAVGDCGEKMPMVSHKRNGKEWLVVLKAEDLMNILKALDERR